MVILINRNKPLDDILNNINEQEYQILIIEHDALFNITTGLLKHNLEFKEKFEKLIRKKYILEIIIIGRTKSVGTMMQEWKDEGLLLSILDKPLINNDFFLDLKNCIIRENFVQITSNFNQTIHKLINSDTYHKSFVNKINVNLIFNSFKSFVFHSMKYGEEKNVNIVIISNGTLNVKDIEYTLNTVISLTKKNNCNF